jgi:hypothetical protein
VTGVDFGNRSSAQSAAPTSVDLLAAFDTGVSNSDNITSRDNSNAGQTLQFAVAGTVAGATVTIYSDGVAIGSAVAGGTTTTVPTNGTLDLADGNRSITARQTESGKAESANSPTLVVTVDTAAPTADVVDVAPDPRTTPVTSIVINFNQAISSFDLADLSLTRDGGGNLLTGAQTLSTSDNISWTLGNLSGLTTPLGNYLLTLTAAGSGITDVAGNPILVNASDAFQVTDTLPIFLVGVDFDVAGGPSPTNWNAVRGTTASGTVVSNLIDEGGNTTAIDLTLVTSNATAFNTDFGAPPANQIPLHTQSLTNIAGNFWNGSATSYTFTFSSLTGGALYEVYVFGLNIIAGTTSYTVSGQGTPATFTQTPAGNQLWVNGSVGSSSQQLSSYAVIVMASATGTITILAQDVSGNLGVGGLAIREYDDTTPPAINSLSPADNAIGVGVTTDLAITFSENVQKGSGDILIRSSSDDSIVQTIAVTSGAVTINGAAATINPANLDPLAGFYVEVPAGAFEDLSGNDAPAISGNAAWNFTTAGLETWFAQGPAPATGGQVENITPNNQVVGAIHTVVAHPTNPDILYLGGVNSGVWKTTNATAASPTWVPLTDHLPSLSIGALVMDPTDLTRQTLVAATGRYSSFAQRGGDRVGLYRTTDGGANWTHITGGGTLLGKNISGIAARGNTIVVSVNVADVFSFPNIGIFRSTNGGASFTQISVGDGTGPTGLPGGVAYDLASDPTDNNVLYTSLVNADTVGGQNGIYKSTNMGATWTMVFDGGGYINTGETSNTEFAVGNSNNVFVGIVNFGVAVGFFRSVDGGANWEQMDSPATNENGTDVGLNPSGGKGPGPGSPMEEIAGGQGAIHFSILADPANPNIVYVGGDRQPRSDGDTGGFPNSIGAFDFSGRLFRGDALQPGGSQWVHLTHRNDLGAPGGGTANNSSPHADSREMTFDANGNIIEVDDGGIYRRTNPQSNTGVWVSIIGNLQATEGHDVDYDPITNTVISGNQDPGTTEQTAEGSTTPAARRWCGSSIRPWSSTR